MTEPVRPADYERPPLGLHDALALVEQVRTLHLHKDDKIFVTVRGGTPEDLAHISKFFNDAFQHNLVYVLDHRVAMSIVRPDSELAGLLDRYPESTQSDGMDASAAPSTGPHGTAGGTVPEYVPPVGGEPGVWIFWPSQADRAEAIWRALMAARRKVRITEGQRRAITHNDGTGAPDGS